MQTPLEASSHGRERKDARGVLVVKPLATSVSRLWPLSNQPHVLPIGREETKELPKRVTEYKFQQLSFATLIYR